MVNTASCTSNALACPLVSGWPAEAKTKGSLDCCYCLGRDCCSFCLRQEAAAALVKQQEFPLYAQRGFRAASRPVCVPKRAYAYPLRLARS